MVCAAVPDEIVHLRRRWKAPALVPLSPWALCREGGDAEAVLALGGVGYARMEAMLLRLPASSVDCWISLGIAGALAAEARAGEIYAGRRVIPPQGGLIEGAAPDFPFEDGPFTLYCSERLAESPAEKRAQRERTGAGLVDMESAAVAFHAFERMEPFIWIKGVSDGCGETMPSRLLNCLDAHGFPSIAKALKVLALRPWLLGSAAKYGFRARGLGRKFAQIVPELLRRAADADVRNAPAGSLRRNTP